MFYHPELDEVALCTGCNKGLCSDCVSKYTEPICESCV